MIGDRPRWACWWRVIQPPTGAHLFIAHRRSDHAGSRHRCQIFNHFALRHLELSHRRALMDACDTRRTPTCQLHGAQRSQHDKLKLPHVGWALNHSFSPSQQALVRAWARAEELRKAGSLIITLMDAIEVK